MFFLNTRFSFYKNKKIVKEISRLMHLIILICHEIEYLNDQTKMFNYLFLSKSEKDFKNKHYMIQKIKRQNHYQNKLSSVLML